MHLQNDLLLSWPLTCVDLWPVLTEEGVPTSVDFVRCEPSQMVAAYTSCHTYIYDVETAKQVIKLDTKQTNGMYRFRLCQIYICVFADCVISAVSIMQVTISWSLSDSHWWIDISSVRPLRSK